MPTLSYVYDDQVIHDGPDFNGQKGSCILKVSFFFCLFWSFTANVTVLFKWSSNGNRLLAPWSIHKADKCRVWSKTNKTTSCWRLLSYRGHAVISVRQWEDASPPFSVCARSDAEARTCARFCLQKMLVIDFSRGIASVVDYYLRYFIYVAVRARLLSTLSVAQLTKCYGLSAGLKPTNIFIKCLVRSVPLFRRPYDWAPGSSPSFNAPVFCFVLFLVEILCHF